RRVLFRSKIPPPLIARLPSRSMVNQSRKRVSLRWLLLRRVELALRTEFSCQRMRRRMVLVVAATVAGSIALAPRMAIAEGLFDFFFGGAKPQQARQAPPQASFFADPFGLP